MQFNDVKNAQAKRIKTAEAPALQRHSVTQRMSICEQNGKPLDPSEQQSAHEVQVALVV